MKYTYDGWLELPKDTTIVELEKLSRILASRYEDTLFYSIPLEISTDFKYLYPSDQKTHPYMLEAIHYMVAKMQKIKEGFALTCGVLYGVDKNTLERDCITVNLKTNEITRTEAPMYGRTETCAECGSIRIVGTENHIVYTVETPDQDLNYQLLYAGTTLTEATKFVGIYTRFEIWLDGKKLEGERMDWFKEKLRKNPIKEEELFSELGFYL